MIPKHVAIIMDGNRRFAKKYLGNILEGHKYGADKLEEVFEWCQEFGIKILTLWGFSTENFNRSEEEVKMLMNLFEDKFNYIATEPRIHNNKIKINVIGRIDLFPERVQNAIKNAVNATKDYDNFIVNFAISYGGKQEIVDAAKKLAQLAKEGKLDPSQIDKNTISDCMYFVGIPDPELIIRTGGSFRTSGFMLWESEYAEYFFSEKMWPEFDRMEFMRALTSFQERKRNFGK